jgi:uncharacterized membrane protein (Fun14 family)
MFIWTLEDIIFVAILGIAAGFALIVFLRIVVMIFIEKIKEKFNK